MSNGRINHCTRSRLPSKALAEATRSLARLVREPGITAKRPSVCQRVGHLSPPGLRIAVSGVQRLRSARGSVTAA